MNSRDISILQHIIRYCDEVDQTLRHFGRSEELFRESFVFRNAVSMPIMQIGELATRLTDGFIEENDKIPWKAIRGMRTFFAHQYGSMNIDLIWQTAIDRIPELRENCIRLIDKEAK